MSLSRAIAKERKAQGRSLRDLGRATDLSRSAIWNAERGEAPLSTAIRVAKVLGIRGKRLLMLVKAEAVALIRAA